MWIISNLATASKHTNYGNYALLGVCALSLREVSGLKNAHETSNLESQRHTNYNAEFNRDRIL